MRRLNLDRMVNNLRVISLAPANGWVIHCDLMAMLDVQSNLTDTRRTISNWFLAVEICTLHSSCKY